MNRLPKLLISIVLIIVAIPAGFYACFTLGMIHTNSAQPITTSYSQVYKTDIKKAFSNIQDIKIYYKQGRINFDFIINSQMSLNECKEVVKKTKDILHDKNINEYFLKGHGTQNSIQMRFENKENSYSFSCSYYIPTPDNTDNPNATIINNYKVWYMNINSQPSIQIEF